MFQISPKLMSEIRRNAKRYPAPATRDPRTRQAAPANTFPADFAVYDAALRKNAEQYEIDSDEEFTLVQMITDAKLKLEYCKRTETAIYNQELLRHLEECDPANDNDKTFQQALSTCRERCSANSTYVRVRRQADAWMRLIPQLEQRLELLQEELNSAELRTIVTPDGITVLTDREDGDPELEASIAQMRRLSAMIDRHKDNGKVN